MTVANMLTGNERYQRVKNPDVTNGEILDLIQEGIELLAIVTGIRRDEGVLLRTEKEEGRTYILYPMTPRTSIYCVVMTEDVGILLAKRDESFNDTLAVFLVDGAFVTRLITDWETATTFYIRWDGRRPIS